MTTKELKDRLTTKGGYSVAELDKMTKKMLEELADKLNNLNDALDTVEESTNQDNSEAPDRTDPKYNEYVLSLFQPYELIDKNPRTDGLRRVAELLLGDFSIETKIFDSPRIENGYRASVVVNLQFLNNNRIVSGAADVYSGNVDPKFAAFALATAETRAEGRALRKAMLLTKVLTAEEVSDSESDEPLGFDDRIPQSMLTPLLLMAKRTNINLDKLISNEGIKVNSQQELTPSQGKKLAQLMADYQMNKSTIPQEILN